MSFLKWNNQSSSKDEGNGDIQSLLEEIERSTYAADKRKASKDLIVCVQYVCYIQDAVRTDPIQASELCLPTILNYIEEYIEDSELTQNLMDTLSILVKASGFKNNPELLQQNVRTIFGFNNILEALFSQIDGDLYSSLIIMEILRESLRVDQVCKLVGRFMYRNSSDNKSTRVLLLFRSLQTVYKKTRKSYVTIYYSFCNCWLKSFRISPTSSHFRMDLTCYSVF